MHDQGTNGRPTQTHGTATVQIKLGTGFEPRLNPAKPAKKHVISASKRTDIPAFYLPWLVERVKEGFVEVPNPLYREQISRVELGAENVAGIVW